MHHLSIRYQVDHVVPHRTLTQRHNLMPGKWDSHRIVKNSHGEYLIVAPSVMGDMQSTITWWCYRTTVGYSIACISINHHDGAFCSLSRQGHIDNRSAKALGQVPAGWYFIHIPETSSALFTRCCSLFSFCRGAVRSGPHRRVPRHRCGNRQRLQPLLCTAHTGR